MIEGDRVISISVFVIPSFQSPISHPVTELCSTFLYNFCACSVRFFKKLTYNLMILTFCINHLISFCLILILFFIIILFKLFQSKQV